MQFPIAAAIEHNYPQNVVLEQIQSILRRVPKVLLSAQTTQDWIGNVGTVSVLFMGFLFIGTVTVHSGKTEVSGVIGGATDAEKEKMLNHMATLS